MDTVYLSDSAYRDVILETSDHPTTETGGILLGELTPEGWFVVEVLDPGPRAVRTSVYFEYNHSYATHLANKVARRYQRPLRLLGLWHRHPGSLDTFSGTDDGTHREYLSLIPAGIISGLVNIDPDFRMTFYSVERPLRYRKIQVVIGDQNFPSALMRRKDANEVARALNRSVNYSNFGNREWEPTPMQPQAQIPMQAQQADTDQSAPSERGQRPGIVSWLTNAIFGTPPLTPVSVNPSCRPAYTPYEGEPIAAAPQVRRASQDQNALLDMLDTEFDYLDSRIAIFHYRVSPQEPGYRLEVSLKPGSPYPYPRMQEFVFYPRQGRAQVSIGGREQPYEPGLLNRWYSQFESQKTSAQHFPGTARPGSGAY